MPMDYASAQGDLAVRARRAFGSPVGLASRLAGLLLDDFDTDAAELPAVALEFLERRSGGPRVCPTQFKGGAIVWRCAECGVDETCVLCEECFQASDHVGHDVRFWEILEDTAQGGCCDCGDPNAWKPDGWCPRHGRRSSVGLSDLPKEFLTRAAIVTRACARFSASAADEWARNSRLSAYTSPHAFARTNTELRLIIVPTNDSIQIEPVERDELRRAVVEKFRASVFFESTPESHLVIGRFNATEDKPVWDEFFSLVKRLVYSVGAAPQVSRNAFVMPDLVKETCRVCLVDDNDWRKVHTLKETAETLFSWCSKSDSIKRVVASALLTPDVNGDCALYRLQRSDPLLPEFASESLVRLHMTLLTDETYKIEFAKAYAVTYRDAYRNLLLNNAPIRLMDPSSFQRQVARDPTTCFSLSVQFMNRNHIVSQLCVEHNLLDSLANALSLATHVCASFSRIPASDRPPYYTVSREVRPGSSDESTGALWSDRVTVFNHPLVARKAMRHALADMTYVFRVPGMTRWLCATRLDSVVVKILKSLSAFGDSFPVRKYVRHPSDSRTRRLSVNVLVEFPTVMRMVHMFQAKIPSFFGFLSEPRRGSSLPANSPLICDAEFEDVVGGLLKCVMKCVSQHVENKPDVEPVVSETPDSGQQQLGESEWDIDVAWRRPFYKTDDESGHRLSTLNLLSGNPFGVSQPFALTASEICVDALTCSNDESVSAKFLGEILSSPDVEGDFCVLFASSVACFAWIAQLRAGLWGGHQDPVHQCASWVLRKLHRAVILHQSLRACHLLLRVLRADAFMNFAKGVFCVDSVNEESEDSKITLEIQFLQFLYSMMADAPRASPAATGFVDPGELKRFVVHLLAPVDSMSFSDVSVTCEDLRRTNALRDADAPDLGQLDVDVSDALEEVADRVDAGKDDEVVTYALKNSAWSLFDPFYVRFDDDKWISRANARHAAFLSNSAGNSSSAREAAPAFPGDKFPETEPVPYVSEESLMRPCALFEESVEELAGHPYVWSTVHRILVRVSESDSKWSDGIPVCLALLCFASRRRTGKQQRLDLELFELLFKFVSRQEKLNGEINAARWILAKACADDENVRRRLRDLTEETSAAAAPTELDDDDVSPAPTTESPKTKAAKARAKAMAKMAQRQSKSAAAFLDEEVVVDSSFPKRLATPKEMCAVCHEMGSHDRPLGFATLVVPSVALASSSEDDSRRLVKPSPARPKATFACGHALHKACAMELASIEGFEPRNNAYVYRSDHYWRCPACRAISNALKPNVVIGRKKSLSDSDRNVEDAPLQSAEQLAEALSLNTTKQASSSDLTHTVETLCFVDSEEIADEYKRLFASGGEADGGSPLVDSITNVVAARILAAQELEEPVDRQWVQAELDFARAFASKEYRRSRKAQLANALFDASCFSPRLMPEQIVCEIAVYARCDPSFKCEIFVVGAWMLKVFQLMMDPWVADKPDWIRAELSDEDEALDDGRHDQRMGEDSPPSSLLNGLKELHAKLAPAPAITWRNPNCKQAWDFLKSLVSVLEIVLPEAVEFLPSLATLASAEPALETMRKWLVCSLSEVSRVVNNARSSTKRDLFGCHVRPQRFVRLPKAYSRLHTLLVAKQTCVQCKKPAHDRAVCLICGYDVVLGKSSCSNKQPVSATIRMGEASFHAQRCHRGLGAFLVLHEYKILLLAGGLATTTSSFYRDKYGAVAGRDRGLPLFLVESLHRKLESMFLNDRVFEEVHTAYADDSRKVWLSHHC